MSVPAKSAPTKQITIRDRLERMTPEFKKALPGHITPEKFVRTVQTAVQMNPDIMKAANTPGGMQSLMAACTKAATDGLIIDGREAALVTFKGQVQYMPMVAGIMKMARNSGFISNISAHVVFSNDKFSYVLGDDERIEHAPSFDDRGDPVAVYAIVKMKDGTVQREVMSKEDVLRIGAQGRNGAQYDPKTGKNYGEWWRKTVIRRISKYLPRSSDRDEFMQAVERIDEDYDFDAATETTATPAPSVKKRGAGAAALKDVTPKPVPDEPIRQDNDPQEPVQEDAGNWHDDRGYDEYTGEVYDGEVMQPGDDI